MLVYIAGKFYNTSVNLTYMLIVLCKFSGIYILLLLSKYIIDQTKKHNIFIKFSENESVRFTLEFYWSMEPI